MSTLVRLLIDVAMAVGLVAALAIVLGWDLAPNKVHEGERLEHKITGAAETKPLKLAVTPGKYEEMGRLLKQLGKGYDFNEIRLEDLDNPKVLSEYDVVFATCAPQPDSWIGEATGPGDRPNVVSASWNPRAREQVKKSLREFVGAGGTLYASDFQYPVLRAAFDEFNNPYQKALGMKQELVADVVDDGLRERIGSKLPLTFDMDGWYPADVAGTKATTYLRGSYATRSGKMETAPLLVKVPYEKGNVIFTSFHSGHQKNSDKELQLLRFVVFAAVLAKAESKINNTMVEVGIKPQDPGLLTVTPKNASVEKTFEKKKAGKLHFGLICSNLGAKVELTVTAPNGRVAKHIAESDFIMEITDAPAGEWKYKVTVLGEVPSEFPLKVNIGEE